jgi:hypothetical protein
MEKKIRQTKQKIEDTSKQELVFTEKEPCEDCKNKEVQGEVPKYTMEELERAYLLCVNGRPTPQEMQWLISFNNRALNDKKQYGCGKCHVQVMKNIQNLHKRIYG